jgi:hypothetical protein
MRGLLTKNLRFRVMKILIYPSNIFPDEFLEKWVPTIGKDPQYLGKDDLNANALSL